jgi:putative DNA primase/helicase
MIQVDRLPPELIHSARGLLWNREFRDGKPTKVPYCVHHPAQKAAVDNPATWAPVADAIAACEDGKADGIGIVLGDGLVGVDLDGCRNPDTGELTAEAKQIIFRLSSYTEVSPSGTGVHVLCRGTLPPGGRRKGRIEMYADNRYFTLTGQHVAGTPPTIESRAPELARLHAELFRVPANANPQHGDGNGFRSAVALDLDDVTLIEKARHASNGAKFSALWAGDWSGYPSQSEGDQALANSLAFWTGADAGRMDRLFRQSGLMRPKWDERRGTLTYGEATIAKAVAGCTETYQPQGAARTALPQSKPDPASAIPPDEPLTEAGAAERFARLHGAGVRFDHRRQRWLMWQGHRWMPDADAAITRLGLDFARTWQRAAVELPDRARREDVVKFAIRLERRDTMSNVLAIAKALKPIADAGDQWDADPYRLCTPSGVVELQTGRCRPGRPEDRLTMQTAAPYDPEAQCPRWERFIVEVFAGNGELATYLQRAIGYSITGITTEQVLFLLYGTGSNGKGTLTNTLKRVLGDYAYNMPFSTVELKDRAAIPNDLAALVGRRFVIASETTDGARLNEARVKALTGCDPITARFLHGEFFTFEPLAKFWLSVNHKPIVRDDSYGFWRRLRLIPFTQRFAVDATLADQLQAEAPGILAWCVRGALAWQRDGLQAPAVVTEATREYEQDSDPLAAFLDEAVELEPAAQVGARDLYEHYRRWGLHHGLTERDLLRVQAFGRKMGERFAAQKDWRTGIKYYVGVARKGAFV